MSEQCSDKLRNCKLFLEPKQLPHFVKVAQIRQKISKFEKCVVESNEKRLLNVNCAAKRYQNLQISEFIKSRENSNSFGRNKIRRAKIVASLFYRFSDQWANDLSQTRGNKTHKIWFDADLQLRIWHSICIVKNSQDKQLAIYHDQMQVYSYNECKTVERKGSPYPNQKIGELCWTGNWTTSWSVEQPARLGNCLRESGEDSYYFCPTSDPQNGLFDSGEDWGYCSKSCLDRNLDDEPLWVQDTLHKSHVHTLEIGASGTNSRSAFKGKREMKKIQKASKIPRTLENGAERRNGPNASPFPSATNLLQFDALHPFCS